MVSSFWFLLYNCFIFLSLKTSFVWPLLQGLKMANPDQRWGSQVLEYFVFWLNFWEFEAHSIFFGANGIVWPSWSMEFWVSPRIPGSRDALSAGSQGVGMAWRGRTLGKLRGQQAFLASFLASLWMSSPHLGASAALGLPRASSSDPHFLSLSVVDCFPEPFQLFPLLFVPS